MVIYKKYRPDWNNKNIKVPNGAEYELRIEKPGKRWDDPSNKYSFDFNTQKVMQGVTFENDDNKIKYIAYKDYKDNIY